MSETPAVGQEAPDFNLKDGDGNDIRLANQRGKTTILYFYPKDDTPGCANEACSFRDVNADIQATGAQILGVSADGIESHRNFAEKYGLNFPLLADEEADASQAYGVWVEKERGGKKRMGINRTTFAIDPEGKVANVWEVQDPEAHGQEVLEWLQNR